MIPFPCLSCGNTLHSDTGTSLCQCTYCGVQQAVPVALNPEMLSLYTKACDAFRNGSFYETLFLCEEIVNVFPDSAGAHWLAVLAQYGVEYVRLSEKTNPLAESGLLNVVRIKSSLHYVEALACADADMIGFLEENAEIIDEQQTSLRKQALKAKMYDVFIACQSAGMDSDAQADRIVAIHLYQRLVKNGMRVYMNGVNGETDEASVFSALHSSKVMFVIGNNETVFNENSMQQIWMRYIQLSVETERGQLIVLHDRIAADALPEPLKKFKHYPYKNHSALSSLIARTTERIRRFEQKEDMSTREQTLETDAVAQQFDAAMQMREKQEQKAALFANLCARQRTLTSQKECEALSFEFHRLADYQDAADRALACARKAEQFRFEKMREEETKRLMEEKHKQIEAERIRERKSGLPKKRQQELMQLTAGLLLFVALATGVVCLFTQLLLPYSDYRKARTLLLEGEVQSAYVIYEELGDFMDSEEQCSRIEAAQNTTLPTDPFAIARMS